VQDWFAPGGLRGVGVLLTAGPTREPLDPVRFMGNRSSGKMGYALATALAETGAEVCLVSGPVSLDCPAGISRVMVETAMEMYDAVMERVVDCALFVAAAAVADYRPARVSAQKLKKKEHEVEISLVPNPDILAEVAALPHPPFTLGFAAETERLEEYAETKRRAKGIDMIAANLVDAPEGGFERDENALTLLWEGGHERFPLAPKSLLARQLAARIAEHFHAKVTAEDS
jgi:phosphopantothenoylcysteine decarboxylase/phosphopantothenate--cysteine ligase